MQSLKKRNAFILNIDDNPEQLDFCLHFWQPAYTLSTKLCFSRVRDKEFLAFRFTAVPSSNSRPRNQFTLEDGESKSATDMDPVATSRPIGRQELEQLGSATFPNRNLRPVAPIALVTGEDPTFEIMEQRQAVGLNLKIGEQGR